MTSQDALSPMDRLRQEYAENELDHDRNPTEDGFVEWLVHQIQSTRDRDELRREVGVTSAAEQLGALRAGAAAAGFDLTGLPAEQGVKFGLAHGQLLAERDRLADRLALATEFTVCAVPEDDINHSVYAITVAYRGRGRWAVTRHRWCLGADGEWDFEMRPSEREDAWLDAHRFDLDTALRLAHEAAPAVEANGITAADVAARHGKG